MIEVTIKKEVRLVTLGAEYQPYYPRFIVELLVNDKEIGTIEVCANCEKSFAGFTSNKEEQRAELEALTVNQVWERALEKAVEGDWLNKPS